MANQHKNNIKELENAISLVKDKKKNLDDWISFLLTLFSWHFMDFYSYQDHFIIKDVIIFSILLLVWVTSLIVSFT